MSLLLDFFTGGPARVKGLLVGALAIAGLGLALLVYALWWRGEALQARGERDLALAQVTVVSSAAKACSDGVDQAKRAGDAAVSASAELVAAAQRLKAPVRVERQTIEHWLEKPTPPGAGCDQAWNELELLYKKAGTP